MQNAYFVTAGIACGKSSFIKIAKARGYEVLDADFISHELLDLNVAPLVKLFGPSIVKKDVYRDKIDRKALADIVFNDKEKKKLLEDLLHPKIRKKLLEQALELDKKGKPFFIELPLFFEGKQYFDLGQVILIYTPKKESLLRLMRRDKLEYDKALKRADALMDIEKKLELSDFVIKNLGSYDEFRAKCEEFLEKLERLKRANP